MKTRSGFVSNSSSTSFLIVVKNTPSCDVCGRSDLNFLDLIESIRWSGDSETTQIHNRGAEKIEAERRKESTWSSDDAEHARWTQRFKTLKEAEAKGYEVGDIELGYHDDVILNIFDDLRRRRIVQIVWDDHTGDHTIYYEN